MQAPDHGGQSLTIGLRDVYDQIQVISAGYTALSAKLDTALISQTMAQQTIAQQLADIRHDINDHEMRMRSQEAKPVISPRAMWTAVGVLIAGLGLVLGIAQALYSP